jgi:hypothetical protein
LIFELLQNVLRDPPGFENEIWRVCMMAAALPVELAEEAIAELDASGVAPRRLVIYSPVDAVLQVAFPLGQSLAYLMGNEEEVYLSAVGLEGQPTGLATLGPVELPVDSFTSNSHSEYWTSDAAAEFVSMAFGASWPRTIPERLLPTRADPDEWWAAE